MHARLISILDRPLKDHQVVRVNSNGIIEIASVNNWPSARARVRAPKCPKPTRKQRTRRKNPYRMMANVVVSEYSRYETLEPYTTSLVSVCVRA